MKLIVFILLFFYASTVCASIARETSGTATGTISNAVCSPCTEPVSLGAGVANGDLVLVGLDYAPGTVTPPAGYTLILTQSYAAQVFAVYYHVWTTGDPTSSINFTVPQNSNQKDTWATVAYTGAGVTPVFVSGGQAIGFLTTLTSPSITPTTTTDMLVMLYDDVPSQSVAAQTFASFSLGTLNVSQNGAFSGALAGTWAGLAIADQLLSSGSATGNQTVTISNAGSGAGIQIAISPGTVITGATACSAIWQGMCLHQ